MHKKRFYLYLLFCVLSEKGVVSQEPKDTKNSIPPKIMESGFESAKNQLKTQPLDQAQAPQNLKALKTYKKYSEKEIDSLIDQMTDKEKVAQLFTMSVTNRLTHKHIQDILNIFKNPGGFLFYEKVSWNNDNTSRRNQDIRSFIKKINKIQKVSKQKIKLPSFIMIDLEGGTATRFSKKRHKVFQNTMFYDIASPYMIAQTGRPSLAFEMGQSVGKILHSIGFNLNMAPVVDLIQAPHKKSYMGMRSFGQNPSLVKKMARAYTQGLWQEGVVGVFKHFPGYPDTLVNSHNKLPISHADADTLLQADWVPYQFTGDSLDPKAVMMNIGLYPKLDPLFIAPLSKKIVTGWLKEKLNFKGLILPDALEMKGYTEPNLGTRAIKVLQAGNDMILINASTEELFKLYYDILKALKNGQLSRQRVHESLKKILLLKSEIPYNDTLSESDRLQAADQSMIQLYQTNTKILSYNLDSFFQKNPHLKNRLPQNQKLIVFGNKMFHQNLTLWGGLKNTHFFSHQIFKKTSIAGKNKKDKSRAMNLLKQKDVVSLCYGLAVSQVCRFFSPTAKSKTILIITKPYEIFDSKEYLAVIPVYGLALESGPLVLERMLQPPQ